jgi:hypothetical protein
MPVCKACALSKAKQKNVPKNSKSEPATRPFKVLDEDRTEVTLSKTLWIIRVSAFTDTKKAFGENTVEWLTQLAKHGAHVDVLQMDPSGENKAFAKRLSR